MRQTGQSARAMPRWGWRQSQQRRTPRLPYAGVGSLGAFPRWNSRAGDSAYPHHGTRWIIPELVGIAADNRLTLELRRGSTCKAHPCGLVTVRPKQLDAV